MKNLVVFDIETTGLDRNKDYIIQFAGIKINRETNKVIEEKNIYIQPIGHYQISIQAYFKHYIKPEFLKDKPYFKDVANEILEFIKDCDILTYNGNNFDIPFLVNEFIRVGIEYTFTNVNCYDAYLEERRRNGIMLEDTYKRYKGKSMEECGLTTHDAFSDIKATYTIFYAQQKQKEYLPEKIFGDDNIITMQDFQGTICPCFTVGKYKSLSVAFVATIDKNYLNWCVNDSNFNQNTKNFIKQYI